MIRILNPNANTFVSNQIPRGPKFDLNPSASTFYPARSADISTNINDDEIIPLGQSNNSIENCVENEKTANAILHDLRVKNWKRVIVGALNINSLRNKIHMLADLVVGKIDILLISETKLGDSFPTSQLYIPGFGSPFWLDRSMHGGGLLLYVRNDIPAKSLNCAFCKEIECLTVEINIWKKVVALWHVQST